MRVCQAISAGACRPRVTLLVLLLFALSHLTAGADQQPQEYEVKAAFLLNFTKFIEWPPAPTPDSPFTICIFGDDPFGRLIDNMVRGETVGGRSLVVRRIGPNHSVSCQILFAGRSQKDFASSVPDLAPGVLTVGEGEEFLRDGGMIAFVVENRRVRFDISQRLALQAGLKISSKLLSVARSVEK